ncbi:hypothetical protein [uncultured Rubinisphaera sp.]|uniref:hypothetical protein n=1 Tax=uncultured Rubinisphaera sp. TaxID=1678686 RepID=UPI0030D88D10
MTNSSTPLLASYGGGHANIIAALATRLTEWGMSPITVGFTTAYQAFLRQGLSARNVSTIIKGREEAYENAAELAHQFLPQQGHPDITAAETRDYFAIGLHDLILEHGQEHALSLVECKGRSAFEPIATMESFLEELKPSCIVTTTSPRFELALLRAGKRLGIPTLAVADIFLQRERGWVLSGDYADHLCVLNEALRDELLEQGLKGHTEVHATGNPAFDPLLTLHENVERRKELREQLGVSDKVLVLWPSASVQQAEFTDRPFVGSEDVAAFLEPLCDERPEYAYMLRPHPNAPHGLPVGARHGILDPGLSPMEAILVSDVVCFEVSTMGLQAHLAGLPTICVGFPDIAVFPKYSNTLVATDLNEMASLLRDRNLAELQCSVGGRMKLGNATDKVAKLIIDISRHSKLIREES